MLESCHVLEGCQTSELTLFHAWRMEAELLACNPSLSSDLRSVTLLSTGVICGNPGARATLALRSIWGSPHRRAESGLSMSSAFIHDSFRPLATGLYFMIPGVAAIVLAKLLWSDSSSNMRPEGCRLGEKPVGS